MEQNEETMNYQRQCKKVGKQSQDIAKAKSKKLKKNRQLKLRETQKHHHKFSSNKIHNLFNKEDGLQWNGKQLQSCINVQKRTEKDVNDLMKTKASADVQIRTMVDNTTC